jgi:pyridoxamine 5'-phosphate oxidase
LEDQLSKTTARLDARYANQPLPRPPGWGGYVLEADRIELWAEGADRVHDRAVWTRSGERLGTTATPIVWTVARLQP